MKFSIKFGAFITLGAMSLLNADQVGTPIYQGGHLTEEAQTDLCVHYVGKPNRFQWATVPKDTESAFGKVCCTNSDFNTESSNKYSASQLKCSGHSISKKGVKVSRIHQACLLIGQRKDGWKSANPYHKAAAAALCCPLKSFNNKKYINYIAAKTLGCDPSQVSNLTEAAAVAADEKAANEDDTIDAADQAEDQEEAKPAPVTNKKPAGSRQLAPKQQVCPGASAAVEACAKAKIVNIPASVKDAARDKTIANTCANCVKIVAKQ